MFSFFPEAWSITLFSITVALGSTLLILPFGVAVSWFLARREWPFKGLLETLLLLPPLHP